MERLKKNITIAKHIPPRICHTKNYFGESLREFRTKKGLTQIQAAELLKVTQAQWSAYEVGKSRPNIDTIFGMARILELHPYDLLDSTLNKSKYFKTMKA